MAANFWASSHCKHWLVDRATVDRARLLDSKYASPKQLACLNIWFANLIQRLGKRLMLRQRPIATATVYFRRFYLKNAFCETDPYLVLATCAYVAAKLEETPVHIKSVVIEARQMLSELRIPIKHFPTDNAKLAEMEFYLLEDLDFHLVVFHPYRSLTAICGREPMDTGWFDPPGSAADDGAADDDLKLGRGTGQGAVRFDKEIFETAWFIVNDTYRTDLCLMYPPYIIAIACLYCAIAHFQAAHPGRSLLSATVQKQLAAAQAAQAPPPPPPPPPPPQPTGMAALPPPPVARPSLPKSLNHPLPMNPLLQKAQQAVQQARLATPPPPAAASSSSSSSAPQQHSAASPVSSSSGAGSTGGPPLPPSDPLAYLAHLNVNFTLVATVVQEILAVWPLWDAMEGGATMVPAPAQGPTSLALKAKAKDSLAPAGSAVAEARDARRDAAAAADGSIMVALVEGMRAERDKDRAFPDGAWPVQLSRAAVAPPAAAGAKRGRG